MNPEASILVIFGITGDLSQRYLLPALYHLFKDGLMPEHLQIVGLTRQNLTTADLFNKVEICVNEVDKLCDPVAIAAMSAATQIMQFDPEKPEDYPRLHAVLDDIEQAHGVCMNRLYYLSIPPSLFTGTVEQLGAAQLNGSCQHGKATTRILVEKPFGNDLASAQRLIEQTAAVFKEEQVFRIDHYLAKQTVQNILTFRAHNPIFRSIWNNAYVASIDIVASEKIGIEGRVAFYENLGALRDFVQSHLLQLLAVTTMDLPGNLHDDAAIHTAKRALLASVAPAEPSEATRGQYQTYGGEVENPASTTETYVSVPLQIQNERWHNTKITISTGKAMATRYTAIILRFIDPAHRTAVDNTLTFRIQPNEGIQLQLRVSKPGFEESLAETMMNFGYGEAFGISNHPDAYERVLMDALKGDRSLFASSDEVLESWRIIQPLLDAWHGNADGLTIYPNGKHI